MSLQSQTRKVSSDGEWMVNVLKFADNTSKTGFGRKGFIMLCQKILLLAHGQKSGVHSCTVRKVAQSQKSGL